ncbi:MAG TPA: hypothetical protein VEK79_19300 [Thermoanaerobaculia bacterium]|nr:hypothetical protein [Burkholderiales bacterium]HYC61710.1 hypothetical protein [Thermoanaerobaculia bacterium]
MLEDNAGSDDFWCPLEDTGDAAVLRPVVELTNLERGTLSRLSRGDWIPDAHIDSLEARGLVERARAGVRLTATARAALQAHGATRP